MLKKTVKYRYLHAFLCVGIIFNLNACQHHSNHKEKSKRSTTKKTTSSTSKSNDRNKKNASIDSALSNSHTATPLIAGPIAPLTVKSYPHLAAHVGQILLGNPSIQVILAGVPPEPGMSPWQPAIIEMFENRQGQWESINTTGPIDQNLARKPSTQNQRYYFISGFDSHLDTHEAAIIFRLTTGQPEDPPLQSTYTLTAGSNVMRLHVEGLQKVSASLARELQWRLRLRPNAGSSLLTSEPAKPYLPRALTRTYASESVILLSHSSATINEDHEDINFIPTNPFPGTLADTIDIYIGSDAASSFPFAFSALNRCLGANPSPNRDRKSLDQCISHTSMQKLVLLSEPEPEAIKNIPRAIYLLDREGNRYAASPLPSGGEVHLTVDPTIPLLVAESTAQGIQEINLPRNKSKKKNLTFEIPPRPTGHLNLQYPHESPYRMLPALLVVQQVDDQNIAPFLPKSTSNATLSPHSILVNQWPVDLTLPSGGYRISLYRGDVGRFCESTTTIFPGESLEFTCAAAPDDGTNLIPGIKFADLGTLGDDLTFKTLSLVIGAQINAQNSRPDDLSPGQTDTTRIPVFEVNDSAQGAALRVYNLPNELQKEWIEYNEVRKVEQLMRFSTFIKTRGGGRFIELSCPDPSISLEDYRRLVLKLDPHAVQIFGCGSPSQQRRFLLMMSMIHRSRKTPLLMTAAPLDRNEFYRYPYFPQIALHDTDIAGERPVESILKTIRAGKYGLSAGVLVEAQPPKDNEQYVSRDGQTLNIQAKVRWRAGTKPKQILIFSDQSLLGAQMLPKPKNGLSSEFILHIPLKQENHRWFRLEIRDEQEVVLASTNFLPVRNSTSSIKGNE